MNAHIINSESYASAVSHPCFLSILLSVLHRYIEVFAKLLRKETHRVEEGTWYAISRCRCCSPSGTISRVLIFFSLAEEERVSKSTYSTKHLRNLLFSLYYPYHTHLTSFVILTYQYNLHHRSAILHRNY